jgi:hypothetical protein
MLPFFVWEWGRRGKLFGKARGAICFLQKMELIRLYVCRVKQYSIFSTKMYHIEFLNST